MTSIKEWLRTPRLVLTALAGMIAMVVLAWSIVQAGRPSNSEDVILSVGSFVDALNTSNYAKVRALSCGKIAHDVSRGSNEQLAAQDAGLRTIRGNLSVSNFSEPTIVDSKAEVTASVKYERNPIDPQSPSRKFTFHLEKRESVWKVCSFDM